MLISYYEIDELRNWTTAFDVSRDHPPSFLPSFFLVPHSILLFLPSFTFLSLDPSIGVVQSFRSSISI
jgi:hypothetical protein